MARAMEEGNRAALQAAQAALAGLFQRCQQRVGSHDCTAFVVGQLMREGVAMVGEQWRTQSAYQPL